VTYIETAADAAFTIWLATRNPVKVAAEQHNHMTVAEEQILAHHVQARSYKPTLKPARKFTRQEIDNALAAMAAQNRKQA